MTSPIQKLVKAPCHECQGGGQHQSMGPHDVKTEECVRCHGTGALVPGLRRGGCQDRGAEVMGVLVTWISEEGYQLTFYPGGGVLLQHGISPQIGIFPTKVNRLETLAQAICQSKGIY